MKFRNPFALRSTVDRERRERAELAKQYLILTDRLSVALETWRKAKRDFQNALSLVDELEHVDLHVAEILKREIERQYVQPSRENRDRFGIQIMFDPLLMRGLSTDRRSMEYFARHVARQVEMEIVTSRFLQRDLPSGPFDALPKGWNDPFTPRRGGEVAGR